MDRKCQKFPCDWRLVRIQQCDNNFELKLTQGGHINLSLPLFYKLFFFGCLLDELRDKAVYMSLGVSREGQFDLSAWIISDFTVKLLTGQHDRFFSLTAESAPEHSIYIKRKRLWSPTSLHFSRLHCWRTIERLRYNVRVNTCCPRWITLFLWRQY